MILFFADGADGAGRGAERIAVVGLAIVALRGVDDIGGIPLGDGLIGAFGSAGAAADAFVGIDLARHDQPFLLLRRGKCPWDECPAGGGPHSRSRPRWRFFYSRDEIWRSAS